jgi:hypothetical protein
MTFAPCLAGNFKEFAELAKLQKEQTESIVKLQQQQAAAASQAAKPTNPRGGKSKSEAPKLDEPEKAPKLPQEPLLLFKDSKGQLVIETVFRCVRRCSWRSTAKQLCSSGALTLRWCHPILRIAARTETAAMPASI